MLLRHSLIWAAEEIAEGARFRARIEGHGRDFRLQRAQDWLRRNVRGGQRSNSASPPKEDGGCRERRATDLRPLNGHGERN